MKSILSLIITLLTVSFNLQSQITVYSEDFTTGFNGWTSISVADPNDFWQATSGYMEMTGFGGSSDDDWLISPSINMDAQNKEYLMFDYNDYFAGDMLELYYSTNYNGSGNLTDFQSATWTNIPLNLLDINNVSCFTTLFHSNPAIDVDFITGANVYFAFRYTSTASVSKLYKVDNFHIEAEYYTSVESSIISGTACQNLKTEVFNLISQQERVIDYTSNDYDIWDAYLITDRRMNDAGTAEIVWDMFTDKPSTTGEFEFDHCANRDNGSCPGGEGQCYNREHSLPKSWWGGNSNYPTDKQYFDLHHLVPSDRQMNSYKSNWPLGVVTSVSNIGSNGVKFGSNSSYPCGGTYFEPIDEYKGDYARMYLFMATRYENLIAGWETITTIGDCALSGDSYIPFEPWLMDILLAWHSADPVSQKEIDRNNAVYALQGNRNPFIDNPQWVGYIWGDLLGNTCSDLANPCSSPATSTDTHVVCDSLLWIDGTTYYSNNTSAQYTFVGGSVLGCDSIVTLDLTVVPSPSISVGSFLDPTTCGGSDGEITVSGSGAGTIEWSGTATGSTAVTLPYTITGLAAGSYDVVFTDGCTSNTISQGLTDPGAPTAPIVTVDNQCGQTVLTATGSNLVWSTGESTSSIVVTDTNAYFVSATSGVCTSSATTVTSEPLQAVSYIDVISSCDAYTWIDGNEYTSSNNSATYTFANGAANGCDSTVYLDLTITTINTSVSGSGISIVADNQFMDAYQWIDCNSGQPIVGETQSYFEAPYNGNFAVIIYQGTCSDTSNCIQINSVGMEELNPVDIKVYPVPADDFVEISVTQSNAEYEVYNMLGALIYSGEISGNEIEKIDVRSWENAVYLVVFKLENSTEIRKLVIQ